MLVHAIGNGIDGIPPAAFGEAFRIWKPPGVDKPDDNNFGWGPLASVLIHKIEKFSRDAFLDATLIASQNVKTLKWNKIVRPQTNQEFLEVSTFEELIHLDSIVAMLAKDTVSLGQNLARLGARLFFPLRTFHRTFLFGLCEFGGQGLMLRGKKENNKPPHPFFFFPRPRAETECHPRR